MKPVDLLVSDTSQTSGIGDLAAFISSDYSVHARVSNYKIKHSLIGPDREVWDMACVPSGWVNPKAKLFITKDSLIDPVVLREEVERIAKFDPMIYSRLIIDSQCKVIHLQRKVVEQIETFHDFTMTDGWYSQFTCWNKTAIEQIETLRQTGNKVLIEATVNDAMTPLFLALSIGASPVDIERVIYCRNMYDGRFEFSLWQRQHATELALFFGNLLKGDDAGVTVFNKLPVAMRAMINGMEYNEDRYITFIGTGGPKRRIMRRS